MWRLASVVVVLAASPATAELVVGIPRIVDGDTLEIGQTTIRLSGIDAPEVAQPGGRDAVAALAGLVEHKQTRCEGEERDNYKRLIARCSAGNGDVNAAMVRKGYAWAYVKYSEEYVGLERAAKNGEAGIWRGNPEPPWDYRSRRWAVARQISPNGCPIKGNIARHGERIYHAPWSPWYLKTSVDERKGERWFCSEREALDAGWRAPYWR